jgi:hypothetical protein
VRPFDTGFTYAPGYPGGVNDFAGTSLIDGSGITIQSNQTYYYYKNLGQGAIGTPASPVQNVTFVGCVWEASGATEPALILAANGQLNFSYCTIRPIGYTDRTASVPQSAGYQYGIIADGTPASPGTWNSFCKGLTVDHCDIWGYANATMTQYSSQATPHVFTNTWVHNARLNTSGADHTDGVGLPAGGINTYFTIDHCWIEDIGDTQGVAFQNSPGPSTFDHFTITNNVFGGWGFTINVSSGTSGSPGGGTYITFTDNVFSTKIKPIYGPLYSSLIASGTGSTWRRNKWHVPSGAAWGNPAHDGWYWMPVDSNIIGTDDTPYVSQTDYTG